MMTLKELEDFTSVEAVKGFVVDYWNLKAEIHTPESLMALMFSAGYIARRNDELNEDKS